MERRLLKVLKGLAEYLDLSLGDLLEGMVLHAFEQKLPFDGRDRCGHREAQGCLRPGLDRRRRPPASRSRRQGS